jgi:hypothetical protein
LIFGHPSSLTGNALSSYVYDESGQTGLCSASDEMDGEGLALTQGDYRVLIETLRKRVRDHWDADKIDKARVRHELMRFFNMVERDMPRGGGGG